MKQLTTLFLTALIGLSTWANEPTGYYNNAIGKHDEALMTALESIIYSHTELSYNYLWKAFDNTDLGQDGYYIDMYSNCKYNNQSDHTAGATYVGQGINREHSFPKSWFNSQEPAYTDLHMLIPTDAFVNQRRSNYPYGVCANGTTYTHGSNTMLGKIGTSTYNGYTETVYEPDDEYKGDFARIYFYMVTCYKDSVKTWPGSGQLDYATNNYKAFSTWSIKMLMEWHRADPVSQKELERNEAVYSEQLNRNPFVDHPELAEYIWGTKQNTPWTGEDLPEEIVKLLPVMLATDTTAVTSTSFRADWTNGGDVSSYYLKVNRIASGADTATLLMSEGFSNVQASSDTNTDISSSLDTYTDNPGWTGYKLYQAANHSLKVGTTSVIGYLVSPELTELDSTVTVVFNAKNWIGAAGSDNSSVIVSCGDVSKTITLTDTPEDYTVVLNGCTANKIKLSMTANKKRFYVYHVDIYNGDLTLNPPTLRDVDEIGDSTWRDISGITDTCYTVQALDEGVYEYMVKAIYTDGGQSEWSNVRYVTLTGESAIDETLPGDVNGDRHVNMDDLSLLINYLLTNHADPFNHDGADVTCDGVVGMDDLSQLINILLKQ